MEDVKQIVEWKKSTLTLMRTVANL
jgi:hypothetical protein